MAKSHLIDLTQHCLLCEHQQFDLQTGTRCGLTMLRPDFNKACGKASFSQKLEVAIVKRQSEFRSLNALRPQIHLRSITHMAIGLVVIIGSYWFAMIIDQAGWISTIPLIAAGVGFLQMLNAIRPSVAFEQKRTVAKDRVQELDAILDAYHLSYTYEEGVLNISDRLPYRPS